MKKGIHPKYVECKVTCGCGERFVTRATKPEIAVEICSKCHPFFTGKQKLVDTAGRVERFQRRYGKHRDAAGSTATSTAEDAPASSTEPTAGPKA